MAPGQGDGIWGKSTSMQRCERHHACCVAMRRHLDPLARIGHYGTPGANGCLNGTRLGGSRLDGARVLVCNWTWY